MTSETGEVSSATLPQTGSSENPPSLTVPNSTALTPEVDQQPQTERKTSNIRDTYESFCSALPERLRKIFSGEQPPMPTNHTELPPGQREVVSYGLLLWCQEKGRLPPDPKDPENRSLTITFADKLPMVEINGQKITVMEIRDVKDGQFLCRIQGKDEFIPIPPDKLLEAQRRIVEESSETGIIKASSLQAFLEGQIIRKKEGESLTSEEEKFNATINSLLENISGRLTVDQESLEKIFRVVLNFKNPQVGEIQRRIAEIEKQLHQQSISEEEQKHLQTEKEALNQLKNAFQEQIDNNISTFVKKIYQEVQENGNKKSDKFTPKEIDKINELLASGNVDSIEEFLIEKDTDNEETKQEKRNARKVAETIKKYGLTVGSIAGILLLLMIFRASKGESGGNPLG